MCKQTMHTVVILYQYIAAFYSVILLYCCYGCRVVCSSFVLVLRLAVSQRRRLLRSVCCLTDAKLLNTVLVNFRLMCHGRTCQVFHMRRLSLCSLVQNPRCFHPAIVNGHGFVFLCFLLAGSWNKEGCSSSAIC